MLNERGRATLQTIAAQPGNRYSVRSQYRATAAALCDLGLARVVSARAGSAKYEITAAGRKALAR